jgi:hypothetical protein
MMPGHGGMSAQPHSYIKQANELDQMNHFSGELQKLLEDDHTPDWVKQQAKMQLQMIELYPLQQGLRQQIQMNVQSN